MKKHKADAPKQVSDRETAEILRLAEGVAGVEGDFVELGCYRGDTSVLLQRMLVKAGCPRRLWIYDSFEGLPKRVAADGYAAGTEFKEGELLVTKREVVEKFKRFGLPVPKVKKGFFEKLTDEDVPRKIAFGFLDGDLYTSIRTSLKLVAPRMNPEGVMIVHDYNNPQLPGVAKAVEEWLRENPGWELRRFETLAVLRRG